MNLPFDDYPLSELQKRLNLAPPKTYNHVHWCNSSMYVVPGTYGMSCCCTIVNDRDDTISDLGKSESPGAIAWHKEQQSK